MIRTVGVIFLENSLGVRLLRSVAQQRNNMPVFICSNVTIGNDSFIGHGVMFINDRFSDGERANGNQKKIEPTVIGARVLVGSNSTILPVTICDDVVIGAGSVVTRNVLEPGIYAGNPARKLRARPEVSK